MIYPQGIRIVFLKSESDHVLPWDSREGLPREVAFELSETQSHVMCRRAVFWTKAHVPWAWGRKELGMVVLTWLGHRAQLPGV